MKKVLSVVMALVAAVACMFAVTACGNQTDSEYVKAQKQLRVGITVYEPMDYYNEDETDFIGFDADLAKKFAEELGVNVKFVLITWANKVTELKTKEIDCIWNGMTASEELAENIDLSVSYATNMQCVVVKSSNAASYQSVDDVKGANKIAVESGSAGNTVCTETLGLADGKIAAVTAQVNALTEVKAGTSDLAIIDYTMAYSVVGKGDYSDLAIVDINKIAFDKEEFAIGFRKGSDLTEKANAFLKKCYTDRTMTALLQKYQGVALNEDKLGA